MPSNNPTGCRRKGSFTATNTTAGVIPRRTDGRPGLAPYLRDPVPSESENPNVRSVDPLDPPGRLPVPPTPLEIDVQPK